MSEPRTETQIKAESCNCWTKESTEHALSCPYRIWMSGYGIGYDNGRQYEREAATPPLNVERLTLAMCRAFHGEDCTVTQYDAEQADQVAAEYARLAQQDGTGEEQH